jgi:hypothetical protein
MIPARGRAAVSVAYAGLAIWAAVALFVILRPWLALVAGLGLVLGLAVRTVWSLWLHPLRRLAVTGEGLWVATAGRRLSPVAAIGILLIGGLIGLLLVEMLVLLAEVHLLLAFAVAGSLLGLALKIRRDRQRKSPIAARAIQSGHQIQRDRRVAWHIFGLLIGALAGLGAFADSLGIVAGGGGGGGPGGNIGGDMTPPPPLAVITPRYIGEATHQDDRWKTIDRVVFSAATLAELRDALNQAVAHRQAAAVEEHISDLSRLGWALDDHDDNRWIIYPDRTTRSADPKQIAPILAKISRKGWSVRTANATVELIRDRREEASQTSANSTLLQTLSQQGWSVRQVGRGLEFTRSREEVATVGRYPVSTTRKLSIVLPEKLDGLGDRHVLFEPGEQSKLVLTGPSHLILSTSPEGIRRTGANKEAVEITLPVPATDGVDVEMLSPLFRSEIGATLAGMTLGGAIKWLVLLVAAVSADEVKRLILMLLRWIQKRLRISIPQEPSQTE